MELTDSMKEKMNFAELDKSYVPGQEKLPVVAYQIIKQVISFIVGQHTDIKKLEKELRESKPSDSELPRNPTGFR